MNKKLAGTGLAIGLVAGAGAGLILELSGNAGAASGSPTAAAVAATGDSTATTAPSSTDGTTDATARPDATTKLQSVLQPLIDDGTITQAQADKIIAALEAARPFGDHDGGPMGGHHGRGFGRIGADLDVVATTLGITADEVRTALEGGQSLADLAVSKGKTAQDVIDAIVADATTRINDRVTAGDLTQAQADKILADLTTRVTDLVNATPPAGGPFGGPFGGRGFGGPGHHGDDNDADDGTTATTDTTGSGATTDTVAG